MFLRDMPPEVGHHELDFRFEAYPDQDEFVFAHHGATLHELMNTCGLANLGATFYMVEMREPFALTEAISNHCLLQDRYGIEPSVVHEHSLRFIQEAFNRFVQHTRSDTELDCTIFGTHETDVSEERFRHFLEIKDRPGRLSSVGHWCSSWLHTHDNHFLWLAARSLGLLRKLINASVVGFFNHVRPHSFAPFPDELIDLILTKYHTAPLVCFPTEWDCSRQDDLPSGVEVDSARIQALCQTAESSWIAYQLNPPKELVGRGLLISYLFQREAWSFEEWG